MIRKIPSLLFALCLPGAILFAREIHNLNQDWLFQLNPEDEQEIISGVADTSSFRKLDLPHDWSIEGPYAESNPAGAPGAYLPGGIGFYTRQLKWQDEWDGKRLFVEFDGVFMNSEVWVNGTYLGKRPYGYIGFSYEITDKLVRGINVIVVKADNSKVPGSRWYTGSGIYRNVRLVVTNPEYIPQWGTFVRAGKISGQHATLHITTEICTNPNAAGELLLQTEIFDQDGVRCASQRQTIASSSQQAEVSSVVTVNHPKLWSISNPHLYRAKFELIRAGTRVDQYETKFGIRSIEFSKEYGFKLNGESLLIKGVCLHHDGGPVGAAIPIDVLEYRLKLLKDMGCNAVRTAHNPFAPEFYQICDEIGLLVMDEAFDGWSKPKAEHDYGHYFDEWWQTDLEAFIKRDRNHPSVIVWSIGNEVRGFTNEQQKEIVGFVKSLDSTRPVTQGRGQSGTAIDLAGFNGHGEEKGKLEKFAKTDERPVIGTEITHTLQTRGVYRTKTWIRRRDAPAPWEIGKDFEEIEHMVTDIPDFTEEEVFTDVNPRYQSSYDNAIVRIGVRDDWKRVEQYPWYMGNFRWTGFDYLGESFAWPARTENFGIIDLAGFPKDHYYLYQSLWSDQPMVHLLPHWTHPGKEGVEIPVVVYTNCPSAELFLNGRSLGEKQMSADRQIVWMVPYTPGKLEVIAHSAEGTKVSKSYTTAGPPAGVMLTASKETIPFSRNNVIRIEASIVDSTGNLCPDADNLVEFDIRGPARLLAVENGDILDTASHQVNSRKAFKGKCLLLVQSLQDKGSIEITGTSAGLSVASALISSD